MNSLQYLIDQHRQLPFPVFPQDDNFADWVAELAEIDAYYMGIILSIAKKTESRKEISLKHLDKLIKDLPTYRDFAEDHRVYQECVSYLDSLQTIVNKLLKYHPYQLEIIDKEEK